MKRLVGLVKSKTDGDKPQQPPQRGLDDIVESVRVYHYEIKCKYLYRPRKEMKTERKLLSICPF